MSMKLLTSLRSAVVATAAYLGDAPHRRAVAVVVSLITTKLVGYALDANDVANAIDLGLGALGGAWSSRTPAIEPASTAPAAN